MQFTVFLVQINGFASAIDTDGNTLIAVFVDEEYGKLHWSEGLDHRKLYDHGFAVFVDGQC